MEKVAYCLLFLMFGTYSKCDMITKFNFQRNSTRDGDILKTVGPSLKRATLTECARMCSQTSRCTIFVWDDDLHNCSIGSETVPNPNTVQSIDGRQRAYDLLERCPTQLGFENIRFGNSNMCIRYMTGPHKMAQGRMQCEYLQGSLVKTNTQEKIDLVFNFLAKSVNILKYDFGIGLSDEEAEGTFVWSDGQVMTAEEMTLFNKGEPDNAYNQDWVFLEGDTGTFADRDAGLSASYICEVR